MLSRSIMHACLYEYYPECGTLELLTFSLAGLIYFMAPQHGMNGICGHQGCSPQIVSVLLSDSSFSVQLGRYSSANSLLNCGVHQGSILGPLFFSLFMLTLGSSSRKYNAFFVSFSLFCWWCTNLSALKDKWSTPLVQVQHLKLLSMTYQSDENVIQQRSCEWLLIKR